MADTAVVVDQPEVEVTEVQPDEAVAAAKEAAKEVVKAAELEQEKEKNGDSVPKDEEEVKEDGENGAGLNGSSEEKPKENGETNGASKEVEVTVGDKRKSMGDEGGESEVEEKKAKLSSEETEGTPEAVPEETNGTTTEEVV